MSKVKGLVVMTSAPCTWAAAAACTPHESHARSSLTLNYSIDIKGLTYERRSPSAPKDIAAIPGVVKASMDDKAGHVGVTIQRPREPVGTEKPRRLGAEFVEAVKRAGAYRGDGFTPSVNDVLAIEGMTCQDRSRYVTTARRKGPARRRHPWSTRALTVWSFRRPRQARIPRTS